MAKNGEYNTISSPKFSPDGKHFAYVAQENGKYSIVLDGEKKGLYDDIYCEGPYFTKDSKYLYYVVRKGNNLWRMVERLK